MDDNARLLEAVDDNIAKFEAGLENIASALKSLICARVLTAEEALSLLIIPSISEMDL